MTMLWYSSRPGELSLIVVIDVDVLEFSIAQGHLRISAHTSREPRVYTLAISGFDETT
jgi:hypothetical protein